MRFLILFGLLAAGCSPLYIPNTRNVPLFREQGEVQGTVLISNGAEVQAAAAITNNFAAMVNGSFLRQKISEQDYTRAHQFVEGGLGYYATTRKFRFELFAGYGAGKGTSYAQYYFFNSTFGQKDLVATAKYSRLFIQPSIGQNNRRFNLAFTPRIAVVNFSEFSSNDNNPANSLAVHKPTEKPQLVIEPALTGKFPLTGNIQGMFQLGLTVPAGADIIFDYVPLQVSFGIQYNSGSLKTRIF